MAVTVVPRFRPTMTGTLLLVVLPFPSWPRPFQPQLITWPPDVSARLWLAVLPAPTAVMVIPEGTLTATGLLPRVLPSPSWPALFEPQASTCPVDVSARLWL